MTMIQITTIDGHLVYIAKEHIVSVVQWKDPGDPVMVLTVTGIAYQTLDDVMAQINHLVH